MIVRVVVLDDSLVRLAGLSDLLSDGEATRLDCHKVNLCVSLFSLGALRAALNLSNIWRVRYTDITIKTQTIEQRSTILRMQLRLASLLRRGPQRLRR